MTQHKSFQPTNILLVFNLYNPHSGDAGYTVFQSFGSMAAAVHNDLAQVFTQKKSLSYGELEYQSCMQLNTEFVFNDCDGNNYMFRPVLAIIRLPRELKG